MKSMIYYPGFEVQNENWLKFALLYFEELRPIIPYMCVSDEQYLSPTAIRVMKDTDLIRPYKPEYTEGCCVSVLACEEFDKCLTNPQRYNVMYRKYGKAASAEIWKQKSNQTCHLYYGKFSDDFYDYCIENGIAHAFENGIRLSKDLAFVYMSLLADIISKRNEMEMFTDINQYDQFLLCRDKCISINQNIRYDVIKTQIEFIIPAKIEDIPLDTIIRLRNDRNFNACRKAYVEAMERYLKDREQNPNCSFTDQLKIKKDLVRILELSCNVTASVLLACSTVASFAEGVISPAQALASAYLDFSAIKQMHGLPEYIKTIGNKVQANRYAGKIKRACRSQDK